MDVHETENFLKPVPQYVTFVHSSAIIRENYLHNNRSRKGKTWLQPSRHAPLIVSS